jgi:C_GCAxxG_C_C family probable redox protein
MLKERATYYYMEDGCNCAEAVLLAANDVYGLGLSDETAKVVGGFGGGMGCGNACGALCGAIAVMGVKKMGRRAHETPGFSPACGALVKDFEAALGSTMCADLRKIHANQTQRCLKTVLAACDVLESHLAEAAKE